MDDKVLAAGLAALVDSPPVAGAGAGDGDSPAFGLHPAAAAAGDSPAAAAAGAFARPPHARSPPSRPPAAFASAAAAAGALGDGVFARPLPASPAARGAGALASPAALGAGALDGHPPARPPPVLADGALVMPPADSGTQTDQFILKFINRTPEFNTKWESAKQKYKDYIASNFPTYPNPTDDQLNFWIILQNLLLNEDKAVSSYLKSDTETEMVAKDYEKKSPTHNDYRMAQKNWTDEVHYNKIDPVYDYMLWLSRQPIYFRARRSWLNKLEEFYDKNGYIPKIPTRLDFARAAISDVADSVGLGPGAFASPAIGAARSPPARPAVVAPPARPAVLGRRLHDADPSSPLPQPDPDSVIKTTDFIRNFIKDNKSMWHKFDKTWRSESLKYITEFNSTFPRYKLNPEAGDKTDSWQILQNLLFNSEDTEVYSYLKNDDDMDTENYEKQSPAHTNYSQAAQLWTADVDSKIKDPVYDYMMWEAPHPGAQKIWFNKLEKSYETNKYIPKINTRLRLARQAISEAASAPTLGRPAVKPPGPAGTVKPADTAALVRPDPPASAADGPALIPDGTAFGVPPDPIIKEPDIELHFNGTYFENDFYEFSTIFTKLYNWVKNSTEKQNKINAPILVYFYSIQSIEETILLSIFIFNMSSVYYENVLYNKKLNIDPKFFDLQQNGLKMTQQEIRRNSIVDTEILNTITNSLEDSKINVIIQLYIIRYYRLVKLNKICINAINFADAIKIKSNTIIGDESTRQRIDNIFNNTGSTSDSDDSLKYYNKILSTTPTEGSAVNKIINYSQIMYYKALINFAVSISLEEEINIETILQEVNSDEALDAKIKEFLNKHAVKFTSLYKQLLLQEMDSHINYAIFTALHSSKLFTQTSISPISLNYDPYLNPGKRKYDKIFQTFRNIDRIPSEELVGQLQLAISSLSASSESSLLGSVHKPVALAPVTREPSRPVAMSHKERAAMQSMIVDVMGPMPMSGSDKSDVANRILNMEEREDIVKIIKEVMETVALEKSATMVESIMAVMESMVPEDRATMVKLITAVMDKEREAGIVPDGLLVKVNTAAAAIGSDRSNEEAKRVANNKLMGELREMLAGETKTIEERAKREASELGERTEDLIRSAIVLPSRDMAKGTVEMMARGLGKANPERVARMAMGTDEEWAAEGDSPHIDPDNLLARERLKWAAEEDAEDATPVVAPPKQETRKYKPFFGRGRRRRRTRSL